MLLLLLMLPVAAARPRSVAEASTPDCELYICRPPNCCTAAAHDAAHLSWWQQGRHAYDTNHTTTQRHHQPAPSPAPGHSRPSLPSCFRPLSLAHALAHALAQVLACFLPPLLASLLACLLACFPPCFLACLLACLLGYFLGRLVGWWHVTQQPRAAGTCCRQAKRGHHRTPPHAKRPSRRIHIPI